jgi:benzoate-CoA ligase family protein
VLKAVNIDAEDDCVWLYSSGTTGEPKGMVHRHGDFAVTCRNYGVATLEAREDDVFFSVPRLYFSYGMGMAMTFPLWVGGTTVVDDRRPTPETVTEVFRACNPTIYAAVPTFYAAHLASGLLSGMKLPGLRRCVSAGEPAPPELLRRWADQTGVPIMEGLGSTEVLQMFVSNRMDDLRPGSLGKPVPGYQVQLIDEDGHELSGDATGRLLVKGDSVIRRYWNNPDKTAAAFVGDWLNTGDVCYRDADGYYFYRGRADDLLKVGGRWVAPFEVESALFEHPDVLEAAVVGRNDEEGLAKIEAWIVLREPARPSETVADEIRAYCKRKLAPYKYPRWIRFANELPKTATGKIQRFKLRAMSASEAPVADAGAASRLITIERRDRVLVVTLSRPPVNALNEEMIRRLEQVIGQAATDGTISVLHLRSSQKVFCAGADLALMKSCFESAEGLEGMIDIVRRMHRLFSLLETAPIVTVAEIGGAAVGGGLEFALACDVRIAADEAELGLPEVGLGLLPGAGGTQRLTRLCGRGAANRLILGAEIINGAEAKLLGMVQWTRPRAELAAWTRELVARIASQPRPALTAAKRCIAAQADSARDGYAEEIAATRMLYDQPETRRRVADFLSRKSD